MATAEIRFRWVSTTPFTFPVVPDEKRIAAASDCRMSGVLGLALGLGLGFEKRERKWGESRRMRGTWEWVGRLAAEEEVAKMREGVVRRRWRERSEGEERWLEGARTAPRERRER